MEFKQAKAVIRGALAEAPDAKLIEVLEAARAGEMPWGDCDGRCFSSRINGALWRPPTHEELSNAYACLGWENARRWRPVFIEEPEDLRQRLLVAMCLVEIRRRERNRNTLAEAEEVSTIAELIGGRR